MFLKSNVNGQYFLDIFIRDYDEFTLIKGESKAWCLDNLDIRYEVYF